MFLVWYIPLTLLVILLCRAALIRAYATFPLFFTYVAYAVGAGLLRFGYRNGGHTYFIIYWITEGGYAVLGALVLYEVFRVSLKSMRRMFWFRLMIPLILIVATAAVLVYTHRHPPSVDSGAIAVVLGFEFELRLLQGLLFSAFIFVMLFLGVRWPQYAFGIVAGFGFYATVSLLATVNFRFFGTGFNALWDGVQISAYDLAVLMWLWAFRVPPKPEPPITYPGGLSAAIADAERYMEVLKKLLHHKPL